MLGETAEWSTEKKEDLSASSSPLCCVACHCQSLPYKLATPTFLSGVTCPSSSQVAAGEAIFHNPLCGPSSESGSKWDELDSAATILDGKAAVALDNGR